MATLKAVVSSGTASSTDGMEKAARNLGLTLPSPIPPEGDDLDHFTVGFLTELARRAALRLPDLIRLVRGETGADTRPNKALFELPITCSDPAIYARIRLWNSIVRNGVEPQWSHNRPPRQFRRSSNHDTIQEHLPKIRRHLRKGQREGRYLVVDAALITQWPEVFISPLGVVDKDSPEGPDIRVINDYSFPEGASVNDYTERGNFPTVSYNPPRDIALRIHQLRDISSEGRVLMMVGDVAGAFRHVPIHADHAHMFAFLFEGLLVVDLACGFGWCGSPAFYSVPGSIINYLYEHDGASNQRPRFGGNIWCDDHTCVEIDVDANCVEANLSLRRAMATVLGPEAINERKFTNWSTTTKALGLLWNTELGTVSVPNDKINAAREKIHEQLARRTALRSDALGLIGSLRHITTCFPQARAFYQRIQRRATGMHPYRRYDLDESYLDDLRWFRIILTQADKFNSIPVRQLARLGTPSVHVYMDASNEGVCALDPKLKEFLRRRFTPAEQAAIASDDYSLSINVRELSSAALAALHWGSRWASTEPEPTNVCFWIDNSSAVAWATKRSSPHPLAQLYNRLIALVEFQFNIVFTAQHISGDANVMADAGSRAWEANHPLFERWTNLSNGWTQVAIEPPYDDLSSVWAMCSAATLSQGELQSVTAAIGGSGHGSRARWVGHLGSEQPIVQATDASVITQSSSGGSDGIVGDTGIRTQPSNRNSRASGGTIGGTSVSIWSRPRSS